MQIIDSHAHIQKDFYDETIGDLIARSKDAGVAAIVSIGTSLAESQETLDLAQKYPGYLFPTVGLHPEDAEHDLKQFSIDELRQKLLRLASDQSVVAIGECGLDYGKPNESISDEFKLQQKELFQMQIEIAAEKNLPLVVHCRNAWEDTFELLSSRDDLVVILHSFTGDAEVAKQAIARGYYLSFSGIVTFKNAKAIQEAAIIVSSDRLLIETDSPFLTPEPLRGQQNEPKNVLLTAKFLAKLRSESEDEFMKNSYQNAVKAFNLPVSA